MNFSRTTQGERIAGISGIVLFLVMIIFKWFGLKATAGVPGGFTFSAEVSRNAFGSYGFIDIVLLITCIAAVGLLLLSASQAEMSLPVAASAIVAGLGILSVVLIIISIISPPDFGGVSGSGIDHTRKIGVWLGLIAAAVLTYGGWRAMQEEGTSFGAQADRFRGPGPDEGPSTGPPPPPPPANP